MKKAVKGMGSVFMTREDWGAEGPRATTGHVPQRVVVHHSFIPAAKHFHGADSILGIQRFHMRNKGWSDIGYHLLVAPDGGYVYQGRHMELVGAHCGGEPPKGAQRRFGNTGSIGICLIGDYDHEIPHPHGVKVLQDLVTFCRVKFGIPPEAVFGHCEAWSVPPKSCPGANLFVALFGEERWARIEKKL